MKVADVVSCSFPNWYEQFKNVTYKSIILPLPSSFMDYLNTDGIVLPESSTHGIYPESKNIIMNEDEEDPDLRDEDLLKQYEADWSASSTGQTESKFPDLNEFDAQLISAIKDLGGRVFPKLNWSSPKDASWIAFDKSLLCTCPSDVYLLLKSSEFIAHDTDQPFSLCEDFETVASSDKTIQYVLVLKEWQPPDPSTEFRCFVQHGHLVGISQRDATKFYPYIPKEKQSIINDTMSFFKTQIFNRFQLKSCVFDIVRAKSGSVLLVDFNPFGPVTDGILFTWEELPTLAASCPVDDQGNKCPIMRCVESEKGMRAADCANYAYPLDIQDLVAGRDPYKLIDLMKMKIQSADGKDSSSEEEEEKTENKGGKDTDKEKKHPSSAAER